MRVNLTLLAATALLLATGPLFGQESVCDLFAHLEGANAQQVMITGDLIISKELAVLGSAECDNRYISRHHWWPTALSLRPSPAVTPDQLREFRHAREEADRLREAGKTVNASASFSGRIRLEASGDFAAELTFDSIDNLKVEALPDPGSLAVIPICDLFQNLPSWKGKRIALRGEFVRTMEGAWIVGRCEGRFVTDGYRWPVSLTFGVAAPYSAQTAELYRPKWPTPSKGANLQGQFDVGKTATFVGTLWIKSDYHVFCGGNGTYRAIGFGHLAGAAGELIVEDIRDVDLTPQPEFSHADAGAQHCSPPDLATLCSKVDSLAGAASAGCIDKVRDLLAQEGIDSKDGSESLALQAAIRSGHEPLVKILIDAGAPVNPKDTKLFAPLADAAMTRHIEIMKLLLKTGAKVDAADHNGSTLLAGSGFFDPNVTRVLVEAGAYVDAFDKEGQTALMKAAGYGFKQAIQVLIDHHADVNLKDASGRTALMHAASGRFSDAIPLLLEDGADPNARDYSGKSALDLANASNNLGAITMLSVATKRSR